MNTIKNIRELIQEICKRQKGVGKGLNARQVGEVLRHLGDIDLEQYISINKANIDELIPTMPKEKRTPYSLIGANALRRAKKRAKK